MVKVILLGRCCRVTLDIIKCGYKQESSLFDWCWTNTLGEINIILKKILLKEDINVIRIDGNDFIEGTTIKSAHYTNINYKEILLRRIERFINTVTSTADVLFVRDDVLQNIRKEELIEFTSLLAQFNPTLSYKLLLVSSKDSYNELLHPSVYHRIYDFNKYGEYIKELYPMIEKSTVKSTSETD